MYIFYTTTHVWHAYCISNYINASTQQQRVDIQDGRSWHTGCQALLQIHQFSVFIIMLCSPVWWYTHSCKYTTLFLHLFQFWIVFFFLYVWHGINIYVLCFFVWGASARQDMVQWSPPDVRLTLRGQITKRKYTFILQNIHTNTIELLNTSAVLFIWYSQIIFSWSVFIIWWLTLAGNVFQRVNDRIESWFSRWGI